jgi:ABC-type sugar transport system substrate-binding protein
MKRRLAAVVAVAGAVLAGVFAASSSGSPKARVTIAFVPPVIANPAIQAMNTGYRLQAKKLGMTALTLGGEFDPQAQITAVNAAIQRHVNGLIIWPLDPKGIRPTLDKAEKAGIKVITVWTPGLPGASSDFYYDEAPAARQVAKLAADTVKKDGKDCAVGVIEGVPAVAVLKARNENLEAGAKAAGCTILERQVNQKDSADGAQPIVQAWKTKWGSKMTAILAYNDPSAEGAASVVSGDFNPVITGMNADPAAIQAVNAGQMLATTTIPNPEIGNGFAYGMYLLLVKHQKLPREVISSAYVLTKGNSAKYVPWSVRNKHALNVQFAKVGGRWLIKTTPDYNTLATS